MSFKFQYNYAEVARDSGFKLRQFKDGPLDWRLMGSIEIERILRDQSIEQIDTVLDHLSEAPLGSMLESNILDSGIAKYFTLSQFSIQYLLFCRKFLEETISDLRESHCSAQLEIASLKRSLSESNNEILQLNKKITQTEAIHEVIYPCYLCTKNFVSNDALNLHISRKHSGAATEKRNAPESIFGASKERDNDLNLINTIKLELEIKQLKERLNNAEREIRERTLSSRKSTPRDEIQNPKQIDKPAMKTIGIQSNLAEIKEKDDTATADEISMASSPSMSIKRQQHIDNLQEKIQDFEEWKEEQKKQNNEYITEINRKLQELQNVVESTKSLRENGQQQQQRENVEDLEVILSKKVEDIGKASAAKLEEVVNKMETNYRDKLEELENGLKKLNEKAHKSTKDQITETQPSTNDEMVLKQKVSLARAQHSKKPNDETFEIEDIREMKGSGDKLNTVLKRKPEIISVEKVKENVFIQPSTELSSESNHTFVKSNLGDKVAKELLADTDNDSTDVSESLQDEDSSSAKSESEDEMLQRDIKPQLARSKESIIEKELTDKRTTLKVKKEKPPKVITRKEAKKLANIRLTALGVDMKTNTLPPTTMKRITAELNEQRNKQKHKYPHFYVTRNKIKKFVDKLCSSKMPENAEALLKATKPKKPQSIQDNSFDGQDSEIEETDDDENSEMIIQASQTSTAQNATSVSMNNLEFKQRLEKILASPISKPEQKQIKVVLHHPAVAKLEQPIPMPRKRVMFNQPETNRNRLEDDSSEDDVRKN